MAYEKWKSPYEEEIKKQQSVLDNREPFQYDPSKDPAYQMVKNRAIAGGRLAMKDTMGNAQQMTGGYGNSYAQGVGQQVYADKMTGLAGQAAEMGEMAYQRYRQQGQDAKDRMDMLQNMENRDYQHYVDDRNMAMQDEDRAKKAQDDAYTKLMQLMQMGYKPTTDELTDAGLTQPQFDAIWNAMHPAPSKNGWDKVWYGPLTPGKKGSGDGDGGNGDGHKEYYIDQVLSGKSDSELNTWLNDQVGAGNISTDHAGFLAHGTDTYRVNGGLMTPQQAVANAKKRR